MILISTESLSQKNHASHDDARSAVQIPSSDYESSRARHEQMFRSSPDHLDRLIHLLRALQSEARCNQQSD